MKVYDTISSNHSKYCIFKTNEQWRRNVKWGHFNIACTTCEIKSKMASSKITGCTITNCTMETIDKQWKKHVDNMPHSINCFHSCKSCNAAFESRSHNTHFTKRITSKWFQSENLWCISFLALTLNINFRLHITSRWTWCALFPRATNV